MKPESVSSGPLEAGRTSRDAANNAPLGEGYGEEEWDFWDAIGMRCAGYSGAIDADLIRVFIESDTSNDQDGFYSTDIAKRLGLAESYVELLKYALCSADFCEYGTSPRGAWAMHGKEPELLAKLLQWYERKWGEPLDLPRPPGK